MENHLKKTLTFFKQALDASLDSVAIVDASNKIVYVNASMKNFLGATARDLKAEPVFCDLIKLKACEKSCQVVQSIKSGESVRIDETPAARKEEKLRVLLKVTPFADPALPGSPILGAIITVRDSTGEILLQAKYHKLMQMISEKDVKIAEMEEKVDMLRNSLRRGRTGASM